MNESELAEKIFKVNIKSALADKVYIIEIGDLWYFLDSNQSEEVRAKIVSNNTETYQITNKSKFATWTKNTGLISNHETKYIPQSTYHIQTEILIFWDTVAMYRKEPIPFYNEINDGLLVEDFKGMFQSLWGIGQNLLMTADWSTLTKQYCPITHQFNEIPVIIYPSKDDGRLDTLFSRGERWCLEVYVDSILNEIEKIDADILLAIPWWASWEKYCDIWKIKRNNYSDDSWFLYDVGIFKDTKQISDMWIASGNTSIVITSEEMLLRDLIMKKGLTFEEAANRNVYQARFPVWYVPEEEFYVD